MSIRPSVSAPQDLERRPSSSASIRRPLSSGPHRPLSAASHQRPASSASVRPPSRVSTRPGSRHSTRPGTRQSSRLQPLYKALVVQVSGLDEETDDDNFQTALGFVSKNLDYTTKGAPGLSLAEVDLRIDGHAQKAKIQNRDALAEALTTAYGKLKAHIESEEQDLDQDIKISKLPDHLQLLLTLSMPPTQLTIAHASHYLHNLRHPPPPPSTLTWQSILSEDPLEGQHWQGVYGLAPGSTRERWEEESVSTEASSILSLSPLRDPLDWTSSSEDGERLDTERLSTSSLGEDVGGERPALNDQGQRENDVSRRLREMFAHKQEVERLQARQYWRPDWKTEARVIRKFDIGNPSTLGPALRRASGKELTMKISGPEQERYIYEHDAYRDVLMALQNRENLLIVPAESENTQKVAYAPSPSAPRLMHLSLDSQHSLLSSFAQTATTLSRLRAFTSSVFASLAPPPSQTSTALTRSTSLRQSSSYASRRTPRTLEAFAEAVAKELNTFDAWCAEREAAVIHAAAGAGPPLVVSLLSLEKSVIAEFGGLFDVLFGVLGDVFRDAGGSARRESNAMAWDAAEWMKLRAAPARVTALVLDALLIAVHECGLRGEARPAAALFRVFAHTAEPVWVMMRTWLRDGMSTRAGGYSTVGIGAVAGGSLDEEFFLEDNELPVLDPDFWTEGFVLREGTALSGEEGAEGAGGRTVPTFLAHVADLVLGAGKAVGLLRALGAGADAHDQEYLKWIAGWRSFADIVRPTQKIIEQGHTDSSGPVLSEDVLSNLVYDELALHCQAEQATLAKVIVQECDLWHHLRAIEDLYLMRRGDAMSHFADVLFNRMDSRKPWTDFHFLNTSFRDVVDSGPSSKTPWITSSLVRFSFRRTTSINDRTVGRTVRGFEGLALEYAAPFPLTYIFGPRALSVYGGVFVFLLQVRRAKNVLERILLRDLSGSGLKVGSDLKIFYAMRGKLSWFVNTLLNFIATNVLHAQVLAFHKCLQDAQSLDEMLRLHNEHLEKIHGRCLLQSNTSALHRAILSVLDMCLYFGDCFIAFAGDATHDITRQSIVLTQRHRSRSQRRHQRNVVSFSQVTRQPVLDESDSESDFDEKSAVEPSFSAAGASVSLAEGGLSARLDKMASELDGLVRFIRRGAESLAGGASEAAPAFGVFAFALEDWDR